MAGVHITSALAAAMGAATFATFVERAGNSMTVAARGQNRCGDEAVCMKQGAETLLLAAHLHSKVRDAAVMASGGIE